MTSYAHLLRADLLTVVPTSTTTVYIVKMLVFDVLHQLLVKIDFTVESRDYAPPFVHARIGQKWGGGLYAGSLHFRVTTITDRRMPRGRAISVLSLAVWWAKLEKNDKVRHNNFASCSCCFC